MELKGKKFVVIGGAGLIGSHTVDKLICEDVKEVIIYDNMIRGSYENLNDALKDVFQLIRKEKLINYTILFSPCAASFDSFKNFEDRGLYFNQQIKRYLNGR